MCGRFAQFQTTAQYLEQLGSDLEFVDGFDTTPLARYNIGPGTRVLMLNQRDDTLHLDAVRWGYQPQWAKDAHRPAMINARVETAATSRMFKPLWEHGRGLIMADGWYEWKKDPLDAKRKQPYFIYHREQHPIFFAAISRFHPVRLEPDDDEGFVIVTASTDGGLLDIHDRRPLVMTLEASREWLDPGTSPAQAIELATQCALPTEAFDWRPVGNAVGSVKNNTASLIEPISTPLV
ncbi:SOS response-associated peptidase family protein [Serratia fonticola]|uniref:SOS response-associated peptidase family protein n=1 Tax=Serratia fonticola TaxID=47917 RepID=UPI000E0FD596|nr:SOS response-associated peptidase family protein [Serratia fonticola]RDL15598.1 putative SOS response-associated peptidase YedK [Serratia fonticola]